MYLTILFEERKDKTIINHNFSMSPYQSEPLTFPSKISNSISTTSSEVRIMINTTIIIQQNPAVRFPKDARMCELETFNIYDTESKHDMKLCYEHELSEFNTI